MEPEIDLYRNRTIMPGKPSYTWPVCPPYGVLDGIVCTPFTLRDGTVIPCPLSPTSTWDYAPADHPELPEELAQVQNEADILDFVRKFGLLGHDKLIPLEHREKRRGGDPVRWFLIHARTIELLLALTELIQEMDVAGIEGLLSVEREKVAHMPPYAILNEVIDQGAQFAISDGNTLKLARQVRREIINANVRRMHRFLYDVGEKDVVVWGFTGLIERIYQHLADDISNGLSIETCNGCGKYFVQRRRGQKYCPPPSERNKRKKDSKDPKDSPCAVSARARKRRACQKQRQA